jgi:hypothetical protein
MFKKTLLFAAVVMALFALPAVASAAEWTMGGNPITETSVITLHGTVEFNSGENGGIHCNNSDVTVSAHAFPNNELGSVTAFTGTECTTYGPLDEVFGCHVEGEMPTAENLPWAADAIAPGEAEISGIDIVNHMNSGCAVGEEIVVEDGAIPVVATANNNNAISSVTLSGEVDTNVGPSTVSGTLSVSPAGTYGIE